jgi:hypothetical protein
MGILLPWIQNIDENLILYTIFLNIYLALLHYLIIKGIAIAIAPIKTTAKMKRLYLVL